MKKKKPIKHKLWGQLKREARHHYAIFPRPSVNLYEIKVWCVDQYESFSDRSLMSLEKAIKKVEKLRDDYFIEICLRALYERRREKCKNL